MKSQMLVAVILAVLAVAGFLLHARERNRRIKLGEYQGRDLMTDNEREFFGRLVQALPQYYVFPQVAMSALLEPASRDEARRNTDRLRIAQQRIDYVVCDWNCNVVAVVELDDRTHSRAKDQVRDERLEQAGIQTLRFESRAKPSLREIRAALKEVADE
jgi:very-short-patch-repair endonuclease